MKHNRICNWCNDKANFKVNNNNAKYIDYCCSKHYREYFAKGVRQTDKYTVNKIK